MTFGNDEKLLIYHCILKLLVYIPDLQARTLACALVELGVEPGDRVGIWGPNYYEWIVCQMATAIAGFIQVLLLSPELRDQGASRLL